MRVIFKWNRKTNLSEQGEENFKNAETSWMCAELYLLEIHSIASYIEEKKEQSKVKLVSELVKKEQ